MLITPNEIEISFVCIPYFVSSMGLEFDSGLCCMTPVRREDFRAWSQMELHHHEDSSWLPRQCAFWMWDLFRCCFLSSYVVRLDSAMGVFQPEFLSDDYSKS